MGVFQDLVAGYRNRFLRSLIIQLAGSSSAIPFILTVVSSCFSGRDRERRPARPPRRGLDPITGTACHRGAESSLGAGPRRVRDLHRPGQQLTAGGILAPGLAVSVVLLSFVVVAGIGGMVSLGPGHLRHRRGIRRRVGHYTSSASTSLSWSATGISIS